MQNLFRRPSGVYVLRIAVPAMLRPAFGKREIIANTETRDLAVAKIVAGAQAAQWRQRFLDTARLLSVSGPPLMDHKQILHIAQGSPLLLGAGFLPLKVAAHASGIDEDHLLRSAGEGRLSLSVRAGRTPGYLVPLNHLELIDPELGTAGGRAIPLPKSMPSSAVQHMADGMLTIARDDLPGIAAALLSDVGEAPIVIFEAPGHPGLHFVPDTAIVFHRADAELSAAEVEGLRRHLAQAISPEQLQDAKALQVAAVQRPSVNALKNTDKLLSEALTHYVEHCLRQRVSSTGEIARIRSGCALLVELGGDIPLSAITTSHLRSFRDEALATVPANENKIRLIHKTKSIKESIEAVRNNDWPVMSASERDKRMQWIRAWFAWLKSQNDWLEVDPASALGGESVLSMADRRPDARAMKAFFHGGAAY